MEPVTEEDLKDMFDMLDVDRSSALRLEELSNGLRALGLNPSESQIESLCRKADVNTDGRISFDEFRRLFNECEKKNKVNRENLVSELSQFDRGSDGTMSVDELKDILCNGGEALTEKQANLIIKDFERDGRIHIEEFIDGMMKREL